MSNSFTESELDALCRMVCERVRKTLSEGEDLTFEDMDQEERAQWAIRDESEMKGRDS